MGTGKPSWNDGVNEWLRYLISYSISSSRLAPLASFWVKNVEFENLIAVWASVFTLKITSSVVYLCFRRLLVTEGQHLLLLLQSKDAQG